MRQGVVLTGLGTQFFNDGIKSILAIEDIFSRQLGENNMVPWKNGSYLDWETVYASNRYFTSRRNHPNLQSIPFDNLVDPDGTLTELVGNDRVHCSDNVVEYYELNNNNRWVSLYICKLFILI
jgi:hypothetical protein